MSAGGHKIVFTGPTGAGKTTAIRAVSDVAPVLTDVHASDELALRKTSTTVAMDYGLIRLDRSEVVHRYGTPGQDRFDFMWEVLATGALGVVILVDNARPDPLGDLHHFLDAWSGFIESSAVAVGITRTDLAADPPRSAHVAALADRGLACPTFTVDGRDPADVTLLLEGLLYSIDPTVVAA